MTVKKLLQEIEHLEELYFEKANNALRAKNYDEEARWFWQSWGIHKVKKIVERYFNEF